MIFFCYISSKRKQNSNGKRAEKMMVTLLILWKCVYGSPIVMSTLAFKEDLFWNPSLFVTTGIVVTTSKKGQDCYKYTLTQNAFWAEPGFWVLNCLLFMKFFIPSFFVLWRKIPDLENSSFVKLIPIFFLFLPGTMSNEEEQEEDDSDYINLVGYSIRWNPSNLYSHDHEQTDQSFQHIYPCK